MGWFVVSINYLFILHIGNGVYKEQTMSNQKLAGLSALYLLMVGIILAGIILVLPDAPFKVAVGVAVIASTLICGMAVNFAGQSDFFVTSGGANSRAVIVVCSPEELWQTIRRLHSQGLQPVMVTA